jgi:hypothetical protein
MTKNDITEFILILLDTDLALIGRQDVTRHFMLLNLKHPEGGENIKEFLTQIINEPTFTQLHDHIKVAILVLGTKRIPAIAKGKYIYFQQKYKSDMLENDELTAMERRSIIRLCNK